MASDGLMSVNLSLVSDHEMIRVRVIKHDFKDSQRHRDETTKWNSQRFSFRTSPIDGGGDHTFCEVHHQFMSGSHVPTNRRVTFI